MVATGNSVVSVEQATAMVKEAERAFGAKDIPAILDGYTDDTVVRYSAEPPMHGKADLKAWLERRFAGMKDYSLHKTLQMLAGDKVCISWEGEWEDAASGKAMQGLGVEYWQLKGDKIAEWTASFSTWEKR